MRSCLCLLALVLVSVWGHAQSVTPAVRANDLDMDACVSWLGDGDAVPGPAQSVRAVATGGFHNWPISTRDDHAPTAMARLAFKKPIAIGAIAADAVTLWVLRADAPYPGDPRNEAHWQALPRQPGGGMPAIFTAPEGLETRAVLVYLEAKRDNDRHRIRTLMPLKQRVHSITAWANANAKSEWTLYPGMGPPRTYAAADLIDGGEWINSGANREGFNTSPPISEMHPTWLVLSLQEPRRISALVTTVNDWRGLQVSTYQGPAGLNPVVATEREWRPIAGIKQLELPDSRVVITFPEPVETRGLKLLVTSVDGRDPQKAKMRGLQILEPLPTGELPKPPDRGGDRPNFRIPYELPAAGYFTMAIDDTQGRRVRTLVANVDRDGGANTEAWDLKDDDGNFVNPGDFRYSAIWHPPLELRYQTTVYPNVSQLFPDRAAWLNGHHEAHGWMADHSAPKRVAAHGDRLYLGSPVAESGVSLVESELSGRKLWAAHSFAAFTGVHQLAVDDDYVYVGAPMKNVIKYQAVDPKAEGIWAIRRSDHDVSQLAILNPTNLRQRGLTGMAAQDGKLYMAIHADSRWLVGAAKGADVDLTASIPRYPEKREARKPHEVVPDPQQDFLRLFRLQRYPPGYGGDGPLVYLESTRGPSNRQFLVLAFKQDVPLGSAVLPLPLGADYRIELSVLKKGGTWPPKPEDSSQWTPVPKQPSAAWDTVAFPAGTRTRAVRIAFLKGEDDMFAEVMDGGDNADPDNLMAGGGLGGSKIAWHGQLEGMTFLRRRYENLAPSAQVTVSSGTVSKSGVWTADRDRPLTPADPAIMMLQWAEPKSIRGLAFKEVDGEQTEVDVYTGPASGPIDMKNDAHWRQVADYQQSRRNLHVGFEAANPKARYLDGYVDFGDQVETRAVRIRIVKQWADYGHRSSGGQRDDRFDDGKGLDPTRAIIYGVAALSYLGGEDAADPMESERIELYSTEQKKIIAETHLPKIRDLAITPGGALYAISGKEVVRVDMDHHAHQALITDLVDPRALAVDADGGLYVYDAAPERQVIRVYSAAGDYQRDIGTPGGYQVGPWDAMRLRAISSLAVTQDGHIWGTSNYHPIKRVVQFTLDGKHVKDIFGPTRYGGNGVLDPWDRNRFYVNNVEYELDWETGSSRPQNILWLGDHIPERPIRIDDRTYMVTRYDVHGPYQAVGVVYLRQGDTLRRVAAMGRADAFGPLKSATVLAGLGGVSLPGKRFLWTDQNGNGEVDAPEVRIADGDIGRDRPTVFSRDLGLQMGPIRWVVTGFQPDGTPIYEERTTPARGDSAYALQTGGWMHVHDRGISRQDADGNTLWTIPGEPPGVHGLYKAKPYFDGQLVAIFGYIGEETMPTGDLGHFVALHSNTGGWHIITDDGLYAGDILRNYRRGDALWWRFPEHERGMNMPDLTAGQEHFRGYLTRSFDDDRFYIVAGHNHASLLEVVGLDRFQRLRGQLSVSADDILAAQKWERDREQRLVYARAPVYDAYRATDSLLIDGDDADWRESAIADWEVERGPAAQFRMLYDDENLYLYYRAYRYGPMKNGAEDIKRAFKEGAAVDLQIGVDPDAPHDRRAPVAGDQRLLITRIDKKARVVLYRAVVPGTDPADRWVVSSPVSDTKFDQVVELTDADVRILQDDEEHAYMVEARIPLAALGFTPKPEMRLRFDWGLLVSTPQGNAVIERVYWANKATSIISDAPSEARLHPNLWGIVRFHGKKQSELNKTLGANPLLEAEPEKDVPLSIDALEDSL